MSTEAKKCNVVEELKLLAGERITEAVVKTKAFNFIQQGGKCQRADGKDIEAAKDIIKDA